MAGAGSFRLLFSVDDPALGTGWFLHCLPGHLVLEVPGLAVGEVDAALRWAAGYVSAMRDGHAAGDTAQC